MERSVIDWTEFLACDRGLLIAPAGHGKTTAIADCLNLCPDDSCQLVLTHTHAGIASLKKKFKEKKVPAHKYQLETITGFAQRYVLAFQGSSVLPKPEDKHYFNVAVAKCNEILSSPLIQCIISLSFGGVFVDEYQDCTISQHNMIMYLAQNLPLHILGDPLQGIFEFEEERLVDFNNDLTWLFGFKVFHLLNYPWRWHNTNEPLGREILSIRNLLERDNSIILKQMPEIGLYLEQWSNSNDYYSLEYIKWLSSIIRKYESHNTLIICPTYHGNNSKGIKTPKGDLKDRIKIKYQFDFNNSYLLLDAIDGRTYYSVSRNIDTYITRCIKGSRIDPIKHFHDLLESLYVSKTFLNKWISSTKKGWKFRDKQDREEKRISCIFEKSFNRFIEAPSLKSQLTVLDTVKSIPGYSNHRPDFWYEIIRCLKNAIAEDISLYQSMDRHRSRIRHMGRKIEGKCIGTTFLTKGLEFDTVIILYPERFEDKKNFYVAISRACKTLVFITSTNEIIFDK